MTRETFTDYGITVPHDARGEHRSTCPQCSHARKKPTDTCLSVNVETTVWHCFNCGWSGSLKVKRDWPQVETRAVTVADEMRSALLRRGITPEVIERNRIQQERKKMSDGEIYLCVAFGYYVGDALVNVKYRSAGKLFKQIGGAEPTLYKLNDIARRSEAIICEGEIDALSFEVAGLPYAVSIPNGAVQEGDKTADNKLKCLEVCGDYLRQLTRIYLALDGDAPGKRTSEEIARRLGKERCYRVRWPEGCKDANDVLLRYGADRLARCITEAEPYPVEGALRVLEFADELRDMHENDIPGGVNVRVGNFGHYFTILPAQFTVVTGESGHGKSNLLDQFAVHGAVYEGKKTGFFTPENVIPHHQMRLAEILIGKPFLKRYHGAMSVAEREQAMEFMHRHFYYIKPPRGVYTPENIMAVADHLIEREGVEWLVFDPWISMIHRQERGETETNYVARRLTTFKEWSQLRSVHTFLVVHPRKPEAILAASARPPSLNEACGSIHFRNLTDNGLIVHRVYEDETLERSHNAVWIAKVKHKFMGRLGRVELDFEPRNQRFHGRGERASHDSMLERIGEQAPRVISMDQWAPRQTGEQDSTTTADEFRRTFADGEDPF